MKIQLKRSNVVEADFTAKPPSAAQMEYGEIAVNYNSGDPVLFIKDSSDEIIRLAGSGAAGVNDGQINIAGGAGISATGANATANQAGNTTKTISVDTTWLDERVNNLVPDAAGDGAINFNAGTGLSQQGDNATANQSTSTTKTFSIDTAHLDTIYLSLAADAGDQTVASTGTTSFVNLYADKYDLESLPTLP